MFDAERAGALHAVAGNTTDVVTGYGLQPGKARVHNWSALCRRPPDAC